MFVKLNKKPVTIHNNAYFIFKKEGYNLANFLRVHNNMWYDDSDTPDYIHGAYIYSNIFIELLSEDKINIYKKA